MISSLRQLFFWSSLALMGTLGILASFYTIWHIPLMPGLVVIWLYHWTVYRPIATPIILLMLWTALYDLFIGNPMGLSPLLFFICHLSLLQFRKRIYAKPFALVWLGFFGFACLFGVLYSIMASMFIGASVNLVPIALSLGISFIFYPLISRLIISYQRWWSPHG